MTALLAAVRAIHFLSLMAVFGGSTYGLLLRRAGLAEPPAKWARVLFAVAASLAFVSAVAWFCLIAGQMSGDWHGSIDPATLRLVGSATRFGEIFVIRFIGLAVLLPICLSLKARTTGLSILAALLLASLAPISHAAAATGGDIAIIGATNDGLHLLMAGFWLGGLMILILLVGMHWKSPAELLGPLRIFSVWGTLVVAVLVMTGLFNAVSILPRSALSLRNAYFALLALKVGLALAMIGLASLNRWQFAPALRSGGHSAVRTLAGSVGTEIALGVAVVGIAGFLGLIGPH